MTIDYLLQAKKIKTLRRVVFLVILSTVWILCAIILLQGPQVHIYYKNKCLSLKFYFYSYIGLIYSIYSQTTGTSCLYNGIS